MNKDKAFLILKNGKLFQFKYDISHSDYLYKYLGIEIENLDEYIENETIVGVINEGYLELRIRGFSRLSLNILFRFLCNKDFKYKKLFVVVKHGDYYKFDNYNLNDFLFELDNFIKRS